MAIDYPLALSLTETGLRYSYTDRDAMLYATAIGMGNDLPSQETARYRDELPFIFERELRAVPTFASVIAWGAGVSVARLGLDSKGVLHGEEETVFHRPLSPRGSVFADSSVVEIYDRGEAKGAVVLRQTVIRDEADGEPLATIKRTLFARRNGGQGGSTAEPPRSHQVPDRPPDLIVEYVTNPNQAVLYRLCGDRTALHVDPAAAAAAGFDRPILHGLCTYGICCRAILEAYCGFNPDSIASHAARFSSPVFPGDVLAVKLWRDGNLVSFEADVAARGATVIKSGKTVLR